MKFIALTLLMIKLACVVIDPEHAVCRPVSMYGTAQYWYLGTVYIGLLVVASILLVGKLFKGTEAALKLQGPGVAHELVPLFLKLLALTCLLAVLFMVPIQYGIIHDVLAIASMFGYSLYLLWIARAFGDHKLMWLGIAMVGLCLVPLFHRDAFGLVENVLLISVLIGFLHFYYATLEDWKRDLKKKIRRERRIVRDQLIFRR